jgi:TetR/AcrR family transcriptional regulator, mexJK operon transcriptional repressor
VKKSPSKAREKILKAAATVFVRSGYASNLDKIASEAGVVRRTVYDQFKSKEELFRAVIHYLTEEQIYSRFKVRADGDFRDNLMRFAREYLDFILKPQSIHSHRLSITETHKHPDLARLVYERGIGHLQDKLAELFNKEISAGKLRRFDTGLAAARFLSGVLGSARQRALLGLGTDSARTRALAVTAAVDEFIRGNAP